MKYAVMTIVAVSLVFSAVSFNMYTEKQDKVQALKEDVSDLESEVNRKENRFNRVAECHVWANSQYRQLEVLFLDLYDYGLDSQLRSDLSDLLDENDQYNSQCVNTGLGVEA